MGNRLTETTAAGTLAYGYNEGNRLLEIRDESDTGVLVKTFGYDNEGNMTERRDGAGSLLQSYRTDPQRKNNSDDRKSGAVYLYIRSV